MKNLTPPKTFFSLENFDLNDMHSTEIKHNYCKNYMALPSCWRRSHTKRRLDIGVAITSTVDF